ncbi:hypothetical protein Patl1_30459 [Pistacia atlantica]|uniref:Uncharacterized protein n=1 Tax=Pistacia atlantica TaxID=434234 RepID=A0ACC1AC57_9ROSI|nr:hypothetical protein Patl1_30459 [Pistacia atlantica]
MLEPMVEITHLSELQNGNVQVVAKRHHFKASLNTNKHIKIRISNNYTSVSCSVSCW